MHPNPEYGRSAAERDKVLDAVCGEAALAPAPSLTPAARCVAEAAPVVVARSFADGRFGTTQDGLLALAVSQVRHSHAH